MEVHHSMRGEGDHLINILSGELKVTIWRRAWSLIIAANHNILRLDIAMSMVYLGTQLQMTVAKSIAEQAVAT